MSSSMFPNPDARAAQEAEGRGWRMENRVNRRFQEAAWAFSCDTLETLLWHFGNTLVTLWILSCDILYSAGPFTGQLLLHYSRYPYLLMVVLGFPGFDYTIADPCGHRMTSSFYQCLQKELWTMCTYDEYQSLHQKLRLKNLTFAEISFTNSSQYSSVNRKQSPLHAFPR